MSSEFIGIIDDTEIEKPKVSPWKLLIVDDDEGIHLATKLALKKFVYENKHIECQSAFTSIDAREVLKQNNDFAVILLDVVMESPTSGLELVEWIRNDYGNALVRIILRTGQPGYAPENSVITEYDINDYLQKGDLSQQKLWTSITSSIRSYKQIKTIDESRKGLELIVKASADLSQLRAINTFAQGVLQQIAAQLKMPPSGIFVATEKKNGNMSVLASSGKYSNLHDINKIPSNLIQPVKMTLKQKINNFTADGIYIYLNTPSNWRAVIVIDGISELDETEQNLLKLFCTNISLNYENIRLFEHVRDLAYVDFLTHLGTTAHCKEAIDSSDEEKGVLALIDIDYFHEINESLGYKYGNQFLQAFAENLFNHAPKSACLSRLHTDVFAIFISGENSRAILDLIPLLRKAIKVDDEKVPIGFTTGIISFNPSCSLGEEVINKAEIALKAAKKNQRGTILEFHNEFEESTNIRRTCLQNLRGALGKNELKIYYQPKVEIESGSIVGMEALLRWQTKDQLISPADFIPVAESSGLVVEIGYWLLQQASIQCGKWKVFKPNLRIAVNVSVIQLRETDFVSKAVTAVKEGGCLPEDIELEVTESIAVDEDHAIEVLKSLKAQGFHISLDDFGTGYSSLAYLRNLPIDTMKIDRSFVKDIASDKTMQGLFTSLIRISEVLDLHVVVEGIETREQAIACKNFGANVAQGFLWSKPVSISTMDEILKKTTLDS